MKVNTNIAEKDDWDTIKLAVFRTTLRSFTFSIQKELIFSVYLDRSVVTDSIVSSSYNAYTQSNMTVVYSKFTNTSISFMDSHVGIIYFTYVSQYGD